MKSDICLLLLLVAKAFTFERASLVHANGKTKGKVLIYQQNLTNSNKLQELTKLRKEAGNFLQPTKRAGHTYKSRRSGGDVFELVFELIDRGCPSDKPFNCGNRNCVYDSYKCDGYNDCGNWADEPSSCKFSSSLQITLNGGHYGDVMVDGRPVCDDYWDSRDAKVVCKELGFSNSTRAFATTDSTFGSVSTNFRIDDVHCTGNEDRLYQCQYRYREHNCDSYEGAGVVCIDPTKLRLVGGTHSTEGNVFINNSPVCDDGWNKNDAQVVCNSLFKSKFADRDGKVPTFAYVGSYFGRATTDEFILDDVNCNGKETKLTDCSFITHDKENCGRGEVAGVRCAKCTIDDLSGIIKMVKITSSIEGTKKTIDAALQSLNNKCYQWQCSVTIPAYPEYCHVLAFLHEAKHIVERGNSKNDVVSVRFDHGELLKHQFIKEASSSIIARIDSLQEQSESFQKQLAEYYQTMARFDRDKAKADIDSSLGVWKEEETAKNEIEKKLGDDLANLFYWAIAKQVADKADKLAIMVAHVAMAIARMASSLLLSMLSTAVNGGFKVANLAIAIGGLIASIAKIPVLVPILVPIPIPIPLAAVPNWGHKVEIASTIMEKAGDLADASVRMGELGYNFSTTFPELAEELESNLLKNKEVYSKIEALIKMDDPSNFTPKQAKEFLDEYDNYTPPITTRQLSTYKVLITQVVENICDMLESDVSGVFGAGIQAMAKGRCPIAKKNTEILKDLLDHMKDVQYDVMDSFADFARAKVSEMAATELSKLIGRSSTDKVRGLIAKQKGKVLLQIHKAVLINDACNTIKYIHFGEEQEYCKQLRDNPFSDVEKLISFPYKDDMCPDTYTKRGQFNIPAMVRRGNETVPKGTLDLTKLLDPDNEENGMFFQIPNAEWLVANGWIKPHQRSKGPFFIKKLQILSLPVLGASKTVEVSIKLSVLENKIRDDKIIPFDDKTVSSAKFSYLENSINCNQQDSDLSPYSLRNCDPPEKICRTSDGKFKGSIYPSLFALWNLKVAIPVKEKKSMPYPMGSFYLKANAELCFRDMSMLNNGMMNKTKSGNNLCCGSKGKYSDVNEDCQACPQGSSSRLNGYFCESCPAGYEPRSPGRISYGCLPCAVDTYKENDGNAPCKPCDVGKNTNGTIASSLCISTG